MSYEEILCHFNPHCIQFHSADVLVDCDLNRTDGKGGLTVVFNSAQEAARPKRYSGAYHRGSKQKVKKWYGMAHVGIMELSPSQVLVQASNHENI
ncbi:MAG: hypothetical protein MUE87_02775 [Methanothrix sp.]|nr:hypothetical protein [Methanothrix sp.]